MQNKFKIEVKNFSLEKTLSCGQTFRYFKDGASFLYPYRNSVFKIEEKIVEDKAILYVEVFNEFISKEQFEDIFGISHDIEKINKAIIEIAPQLREAVEYSKGIRLMKMPPFETTISFLFSIQSQIPVIASRLNKLSELANRSVSINEKKIYLFPRDIDILSMSINDIKSLKLGFREKFFLNLVKNYKEDDFEKLNKSNYEEKKKFLKSILGIGEKVSECIILFGYGDLSAFPVDTWIIKGLEKFFNQKGSIKRLTEFGRNTFKEYSGYAQQYIYFYMRNFLR